MGTARVCHEMGVMRTVLLLAIGALAVSAAPTWTKQLTELAGPATDGVFQGLSSPLLLSSVALPAPALRLTTAPALAALGRCGTVSSMDTRTTPRLNARTNAMGIQTAFSPSTTPVRVLSQAFRTILSKVSSSKGTEDR